MVKWQVDEKASWQNDQAPSFMLAIILSTRLKSALIQPFSVFVFVFITFLFLLVGANLT